MIKKVPASKLYVSEPPPFLFGNGENEPNNSAWTCKNWLQSRFHFSFAEYSNPGNSSFGALRVMNDDLVQPNRGFGTHGHANMEICTYIIDGQLTHQDSMGTSETLGRGSVQFMTAGVGVRHSEFNHSRTEPLRFIQMWLLPNQRELPVNYGSVCTELADRLDRWCHLVSDVGGRGRIHINQAADIRVAELSKGKSLEYRLPSGRQAYFLCMEGRVSLRYGDTLVTLERHDAAEIYGGCDFTTAAPSEAAHCLVVETTGATGRRDL